MKFTAFVSSFFHQQLLWMMAMLVQIAVINLLNSAGEWSAAGVFSPQEGLLDDFKSSQKKTMQKLNLARTTNQSHWPGVATASYTRQALSTVVVYFWSSLILPDPALLKVLSTCLLLIKLPSSLILTAFMCWYGCVIVWKVCFAVCL